MCNRWRLNSLAAVLGIALAAGVVRGQPIDAATATGEYAGGGVLLTANDLRGIVYGDDATGGPRGGGVGNVLLVECNGAFGFSSIQAAIDAAADGDMVIVLPNDCTDEGRWFENIDFLGKAIRVQSATTTNPAIVATTIIDGDSFGTVVTFANGEGNDSVLDGLTIANGDATNSVAGGGIHCLMSGPTIRRCVIRDNIAERGGGLRLEGGVGAVVETCQFVDNKGVAFGSAIHADSSSSITIRDCDFMGHTGPSGLSFFVGGTDLEPCGPDTTCVWIDGCRFIDNSASTLIRGNWMEYSECLFSGNDGNWMSGVHLKIRDSRFEHNTAPSPGGVYATHQSVIESCEFVDNEATGGNVATVGALSQIRGCLFDSNWAPDGAVCAMHLDESVLEDCSFVNNDSKLGASYLSLQRNGRIERCEFLNNQSTTIGGGMQVVGSLGAAPASVHSCRFEGNFASSFGGGAAGYNARFDSCLFVGNRAGQGAGAIYGINMAIADHCTIVGNRAASGGGTYRMNLSNSIAFNNRNSTSESQSAQLFGAATATYSVIQNLTTNVAPPGETNASVGNRASVPQFVDPGYWDDMGTPGNMTDDVFVPGDYHLTALSPCMDRGDPNFVADEGETDFDGEPRIMNCRVDIGADEFTRPEPTRGDYTGNGIVTLADLSQFLDGVLDPTLRDVCLGDLNGDGRLDGLDVAEMAGALLDE